MEQTLSKTVILELHTYNPDCEVFLRTNWPSMGWYKIYGTQEYVSSMVVLLLNMLHSNPATISYTGETNELARQLKTQIEKSIFDK